MVNLLLSAVLSLLGSLITALFSNLSGNKMDTECIQNGYKKENQNFNEISKSQRGERVKRLDTVRIHDVYKMDTQDRGRLEEELGKDRLEEEDEEHHQFSSPSESINHFIATHQISFSKYQLQQINEFKQQLNDERLVVHILELVLRVVIAIQFSLKPLLLLHRNVGLNWRAIKDVSFNVSSIFYNVVIEKNARICFFEIFLGNFKNLLTKSSSRPMPNITFVVRA